MKRSELLPEIFYDEIAVCSAGERFQNVYLRGILKYQDAHLRLLVEHTCEKVNPAFKELSSMKQKRFMENQLENNASLRQQCLGIIIGFLEEEQMIAYFELQQDINKRILQMVRKRVCE